jgi:hypothetical protein
METFNLKRKTSIASVLVTLFSAIRFSGAYLHLMKFQSRSVNGNLFCGQPNSMNNIKRMISSSLFLLLLAMLTSPFMARATFTFHVIVFNDSPCSFGGGLLTFDISANSQHGDEQVQVGTIPAGGIVDLGPQSNGGSDIFPYTSQMHILQNVSLGSWSAACDMNGDADFGTVTVPVSGTCTPAIPPPPTNSDNGDGGGGPPPPTPPPPPPPCPGCPSCSGMPVWWVSEPYTSLWLQDEPLGYQPTIGSRISFVLLFTANQ